MRSPDDPPQPDPGHDLLHWVDRLRAPYTDFVWQPEYVDDDGHRRGGKVAAIHQEGMLARLRHAVVGSIGAHAGGAGLDSERLPFNAAARELYDAIEMGISNLYVGLVSRPVFLHPEQTLTEWYIALTNAIRRREVDAGVEDLHRRVLQAWVESVEALFDPPRQREWKSLCPHCREEWAYDSKTGDRIRALILTYRESNYDQPITVLGAECRFCGWKWAGRRGVRELMRHIAHAEQDESMLADLVSNDGTIP